LRRIFLHGCPGSAVARSRSKQSETLAGWLAGRAIIATAVGAANRRHFDAVLLLLMDLLGMAASLIKTGASGAKFLVALLRPGRHSGLTHCCSKCSTPDWSPIVGILPCFCFGATYAFRQTQPPPNELGRVRL
jgi:hypothetical protein